MADPSPSTLATLKNIESSQTTEDSDQSVSRAKKLKTIKELAPLEDRLNDVLCCAVCLDLPASTVYQCRNGHLMCSDCFNHLLADALLRLATAVCPSCRTLISRELCVRNLIVEKATSELPVKCDYCVEKFPRWLRPTHIESMCEERPSMCKYHRIGCPWDGPFKNKSEHENRCAQPNKEASEIMRAIPNMSLKAESNSRSNLCDYMSFEKISYNDLQLLGPYHTDEYFIRFETFRFCAFGMEWEIRAHVNNNESDPTLSCERTLSYQLLLKDSVHRPVNLHYTVVRGPLGEMKLMPRIEHFNFCDEAPESHFALLPLKDSVECYRLLSGTIRFRLIMFWNETSPPPNG